MNGCIYRTKDNECDLYTDGFEYKPWCVKDMNLCKGRKMSNADRIRAMTDEELAAFLGFVIQDGYCYGAGLRNELKVIPVSEHREMIEWLKSEAKDA